MTILYGWVAPAFFSGAPADHTWVTSFDSQSAAYEDIESVTAANEHFWYSHGKYRECGTPPEPIAGRAGSLHLAKCLVQPNVPSSKSRPARGTITIYGIHGVCHQLSNQVLFATKTALRPPAMVNQAHYYRHSSSIYGDYGLRAGAWYAGTVKCRIAAQPIVLGIDLVTGTAMPADSFDEAARAVLGDGDPRLDALRGSRRDHRSRLRSTELPRDADEAADGLNKLNQRFFDQTAEMLGGGAFEHLFGHPAFTPVSLVDPEEIGAGRGTAPGELRPA